MIGLMPKVSDKAERLRKHILIIYAVIHKNAVIILSCYLFAENIALQKKTAIQSAELSHQIFTLFKGRCTLIPKGNRCFQTITAHL